MKQTAIWIKQHDTALAAVFAALSAGFVMAILNQPTWLDWAFARHENQLSWFIRPLFLVPFCWFAFHCSLAGIFITLFLLLTSMCWFPQPAQTHPLVKDFLAFEKNWLLADWNATKMAFSLLVPASLSLLACAFWKRNLWLGLATLAAIAVMKTVWSLFFGGESGSTVITPAVIGLLLGGTLIYLGLWRKGDDN